MFKNSLNRFFPIPNFLMASSFGIDISDKSIKFAEFLVVKTGIKVGRNGEKDIPDGVIQSGKIKDPKRLKEILQSLKKELNIKSARISLPEEQVYLFELMLSKDGLKSVRESIELALEEHIPVPAEEAIFDYEILNETDTSLELEVAAIQVNVLKEYLSVFGDAMIPVQSCELEAQAISRAVIKKGDKDTYMIVDFGHTRSGIFIVSQGVVVFTSTLDVGGKSLVDVIQKSLNLGAEEAEKLKRENGLSRNTENKELFSILLNVVSVLRDEVDKHFIYWHTHKDENGKDRPRIKKIILCLGESNLIGLSEYISVSMKIPVELANVWINIKDTSKYVPDIKSNKSLAYAAVFGLALGDFEYS